MDLVEHSVTPDEILKRLEAFWTKKWQIDHLPSEEEWHRILNFSAAFIPRGHMSYQQLGVEEWIDINKRYGPRSARGPDGVDPRDLQRMPRAFQERIVSILNQCESEQYWPKALRTGFVHSLAKVDHAKTINQFRPVIIYPTIYRSWGSIRSKAILRHLSQYVHETQIGFVPGREVGELWMLLQGIIELGLLEGEGYVGFVTDLKKAFETLPRFPIWQLAKHLGLPEPVILLWARFLEVTDRRFLVEGEIGDSILSNHGFPEGCSLSCTAMTLAGISLHHYMKEFSRRSRTLSYVDNIELLGKALWDLQCGIISMQTWTSMWKLELDIEKSFIWATDADMRKDAQRLGWNVCLSAKDLGAQMNYGRSNHVKGLADRVASLDHLWIKLKKAMAPCWQKLRLLRQAF